MKILQIKQPILWLSILLFVFFLWSCKSTTKAEIPELEITELEITVAISDPITDTLFIDSSLTLIATVYQSNGQDISPPPPYPGLA